MIFLPTWTTSFGLEGPSRLLSPDVHSRITPLTSCFEAEWNGSLRSLESPSIGSKREDPELLQQIPEQRAIISFRNILVHGYDTIDDRIVWDIIEEELGALLDTVDTLLQQKTIEQEQ